MPSTTRPSPVTVMAILAPQAAICLASIILFVAECEINDEWLGPAGGGRYSNQLAMVTLVAIAQIINPGIQSTVSLTRLVFLLSAIDIVFSLDDYNRNGCLLQIAIPSLIDGAVCITSAYVIHRSCKTGTSHHG